MKELLNPDQTPPGGWRWKHPETGQVIHAANPHGLFGAVRQFLGNNGFPIPLDINQRIISDLDDAIQKDMTERGLPAYALVRDTEPPSLAARIAQFGHSMKQWMADGVPVVSQEEFDRRLVSCHTCQYWGGSSAFGYAACGKCGCSGLKLFLSTSRCPATPPRW